MIKVIKYLFFTITLIISFNCQMQKNGVKAFKTLAYSEYGAEMETTQQIIRSAEEFEKTYHNVYKNISPIPEIPSIDFKKKSVVFLHFGTFNYGGIQYKVEKITLKDEDLNIQLDRQGPKIGEPSMTVMTHPFMFIELPKLDAKVKNINLTKNDSKL